MTWHAITKSVLVILATLTLTNSAFDSLPRITLNKTFAAEEYAPSPRSGKSHGPIESEQTTLSNTRAEPTVSAAPSQEEIKQWAQQLADDRFHVRANATDHLYKAGALAAPALANALEGQDPEVQSRVHSIAGRWANTYNISAMNAIQESAPQLMPKFHDGFALDGYCPVTLKKGEWARGDDRWSAEHRLRVYLFASEAAKQKFLANPSYYAPVLSCNDAVLVIDERKAVEGKREHGVFYRDRVYLFSSEATLARFSDNPTRYSSLVDSKEAEANKKQAKRNREELLGNSLHYVQP